jgi:hypothetical protein
MWYRIFGYTTLSCVLALVVGCSPTSRNIGCELDGDCPAGEGCLDGQCEAVDCRTDGDCVGGQVCLDHTCEDQGTCTRDGQCPQGSICADQTCQPGCRADVDCPDESVCSPDLGAHGRCVDCRDDGDCEVWERCVDDSCQAECTGDPDCPAGYTCIAQQCILANLECDLLISPDTPVEFGTAPVNSVTVQPFTLANQGTGPCTITEFELRDLDGGYEVQFNVFVMTELPLVLAPPGQGQDQAKVEVWFFPNRVGKHGATFWLHSDDPDLSVGQNEPTCQALDNWSPGTACIPLSGTSKATCVGLVALPAMVEWEGVTTGCNSQDRSILIYNTGQTTLTIADLRIDQAADGGFDLWQAPALPIVLQPRDSFEVGLRFFASVPGLETANLVLELAIASCQLAVPLLAFSVEDAANAEDVFHQPFSPQVDVLWVVDNSATMHSIQAALAQVAVEFIKWAVHIGLDFNIGVVTTDMEDPTQSGRLQGDPLFVTQNTPDAATAFANNVQVGTFGSPSEMGLAASVAALSEPLRSTYNDGFLRGGGAELNVIYISDENDHSPMGTDFYVDFFIQLLGYLELIDLSAVVGDAPGGCHNEDHGIWADAGRRYIEMANTFSGMFQSVCDPDWDALFAHLGLANLTPQRSFVLSRLAIEGSIIARIDGQLVPHASFAFAADGWTFTGLVNGLWFGDDVIPPYGSTLNILYEAACP